MLSNLAPFQFSSKLCTDRTSCQLDKPSLTFQLSIAASVLLLLLAQDTKGQLPKNGCKKQHLNIKPMRIEHI